VTYLFLFDFVVRTLTCGTLFFSVLKWWWYASLAVVLTIPAGTLLGEGIKILVHRELPFHESPFLDLTGYSFPSGHTISATLLYGLLAVFAILLFKSWRWRAVAAVSALLMVFLVGLSRIALGAHYPTDVLGAIVASIVWLAVCLLVVQRIRRAKLRVGGAEPGREKLLWLPQNESYSCASVETVAQSIRGVIFLVPGALGVQEGEYLAVARAVDISGSTALAAALVRRARELILRVPGVFLWQLIETRHAWKTRPNPADVRLQPAGRGSNAFEMGEIHNPPQ
jgi:membrane-associated phospholipid phosphatase